MQDIVEFGHRHQCGFHLGRAWEQFEHRRSDHTQGAFRPDEQVFEVITSVVFAQRVKLPPYAAIGQDHLKAEDEVPGIAELQDRGEHIYEDAEKAIEEKAEEIATLAKSQVDAVKGAISDGKNAYFKELKKA